MQITVQVSEKMRRQAESHGLPVVDFYAMLIARGLEAVDSGQPQSSAPLSLLAAPIAPGTPAASRSAMDRAIERVRFFRRLATPARD